MADAPDVTQLLAAASAGDREALDAVLPLVYAELRSVAERYLRREPAGHTLQPTALVHEAYLRLVGQHNVNWQNRAQFIGVAAQMMRRILVNHVEAKRAGKRGGGAQRILLDDTLATFHARNLDVLAVDEALTRLASVNERKARVIELRYFGGLTTTEIAEVLTTSVATVERDYTFARAWLQRELSR